MWQLFAVLCAPYVVAAAEVNSVESETCCQTCKANFQQINSKLDLLLDIYRRIANTMSPSKQRAGARFVAHVNRNFQVSTVQHDDPDARTEVVNGTKQNLPLRPTGGGNTEAQDAGNEIGVTEAELDVMYRNNINEYSPFCLSLFKRLYTVEEMVGRSVNPTDGRNGLEPRRVSYLKATTKKYYFPAMSDKEYETSVWRICRERMNKHLSRVTAKAAASANQAANENLAEDGNNNNVSLQV